MATRVLRACYYWPTLKVDCADSAKKCTSCQEHGNLIHIPTNELKNIISPWSFALWGMDIVGPFPLTLGQRRLLVVVVNYFTKWIEAKSLTRITL